MRLAILAVVILLHTTTSARAEFWPTLEQYVKQCDLIVLCETEMSDGRPMFKVVEEWKGKYKATDFNEALQSRIPQPGYLPSQLGLHSGRQSHAGQKVVFFFTLTENKYDSSSTSFDVRQGKLIYAETGNSPQDYSLEEFKKVISPWVASQQSDKPTAADSNGKEIGPVR